VFGFEKETEKLKNRYFADRGVFCAGRVPKDDLARVAKATGAQVRRKEKRRISRK
jgi:chaperonin GroEL (HSP60 family)